MKRLSLFLCLLCLSSFLLSAQAVTGTNPIENPFAKDPDKAKEFEEAQEAEFPEYVESEQEKQKDAESDTSKNTPAVKTNDFVYKTNQKGDQFIKLALLVDFPLLPKNLNIGGAGTLGYSYFLTNAVTIGGDISFLYSTTLGSNVFYTIPLMVKTSYQFTAGKFEFPLTLGMGIAFQSYLDRFYAGMVIKPEAGAFFRLNPSWSAGLQTGLYILPQWYKNPDYNRTGLILDLAATVRYHF